MMGSTVGGVRLPGPPHRGEEGRGEEEGRRGGWEERRGEVCRSEGGGEGEGAEGEEGRRRLVL